MSVYSERFAGGNPLQHGGCSVLAREWDRRPPGGPSVRGRGGNPSLGMSGAVGLPGTPLGAAGTSRAFRAWQQKQAQRLAGIWLPKQMFEKAKTRDKKRTAVWWYSQEALQIPPPRSCVSFPSLDFPKQLVASCGGELSHACNALAPKASLGNFPLLGRGKWFCRSRAKYSCEPRGNALGGCAGDSN